MKTILKIITLLAVLLVANWAKATEIQYVSYEAECQEFQGTYLKEFSLVDDKILIVGLCNLGSSIFRGKAITQIGK